MSDAELRELRRTWERTRSVEDEAQWLRARLRAGELHPSRLAIAAHAGHEPAQAIHVEAGRPVKLTVSPLQLRGGPPLGAVARFPRVFLDPTVPNLALLLPLHGRETWPPSAEEMLRWVAQLIELGRTTDGVALRELCRRIGVGLVTLTPSVVGTPPSPAVITRTREVLAARGLAMPPPPGEGVEDAEADALLELGGEALPHLLLAPAAGDLPGLDLALGRVVSALSRAVNLGTAVLRGACLARADPSSFDASACLSAAWTMGAMFGQEAVGAAVRAGLMPWLLHGREEGSRASPYED